jgi:glyoxylase-like metal-dependent hydrolase (beta-lactamase superfamily II)
VFAAKSESDPLGLFLDSLMQFHQLPDDTLVLPSHGLPFRGIKQRIAQLQEHHAQRCEELLTAIDQSVCAAELLPILFARELDTHQTMFAMGEAIAHLNYLTYRHRLIKSIDNVGIMRFSRLPS